MVTLVVSLGYSRVLSVLSAGWVEVVVSGESGSGSWSVRPGYLSPEEADGTSSNGAGSGSFAMDIAAMRRFLPQWQSYADRLEAIQNVGKRLRGLPPPAQDKGSLMQKASADFHADAYVLNVQQQRDYAQFFVDSLTKAIDLYERQDDAARDALRKNGMH